jgi:hypothetical protein
MLIKCREAPSAALSSRTVLLHDAVQFLPEALSAGTTPHIALPP